MLSPDDQATRGLTKPYLTYNEFSAKLLSNPAYYTDVCAVATLTDNYYHKKFNQNLVQTGEEKSTSPVSVAETMCRNNIQQSEYEQVSSKQPPDKNTELCESPSKGDTQSDAKDNPSTSSIMPSPSTKTGTDGRCAKDNWNAFLSAESNFRKYQFQQKSPNGTNSDSNCVKDQPMESPSNKQPSGTSDSEERLQRRTLNPMVIDLISDDEGSCEIPNCNLPDLDHNSSHSSLLDIKIIDLDPDPDPGATERLMPQLSPLDSDASVAESTKDVPPEIEIINLPSSPEMPTLIPFTTETEEPFKESSSCVSDNESNSSNRKDNHSVILGNDHLQPKVVLERISLENCLSAQKKVKLLAIQNSTQSQKNKKIKTEHIIPEIDVIDGLNFLSFSSKIEMEKHCDVNRYKLLYNDKQIPGEVNTDVRENVLIDKVCNDEDENKFNVVKETVENKFAVIENTNKDKLSSDQSSIITPRTPDTTEVKDLKNKYLNSESEFTSVFEDSSQQKSGCEENKPTVPLLEEGSSRISVNILHIKSDDEKPPVISTPINSVCSEMLKKVPEDCRGVFFSDDLESFLKNDAELHVELLQKVNPNIIPIASDNPILSLGKLKKSDDFKIHVPRRSFMRQRSSLNSVSISKQENKPFHNLIKDKASGQSSNSSTPSPILRNKKQKNPPNYAVANVKRKFDGMRKSLKKAKLCQSRTGIDRFVLKLQKKYSGLSDEYKVVNIADTHPKTKSNLIILKQENTCTDRNSLMVIKETAFSTQEKEKEKAILDVFLRNFNSFGTTKGLVNMLFTSTGSIFLNNEVLEPDLCATSTSVKSLLNSKCINTKIRCKRNIFSPTMLLTKRSNLLESSAFNIEAESSSNDEVEEESDSEEDEVSTSEGDVEQESVSEDDVKEESSSDFEEKSKFELANCAVRGKNNKSYTLRQMKHTEALSRNKRNTRMPQRLLDSAILAPGSEWVSPTLIEENQNGLRKNKRSTILSKQIIEQEPITNVSRVMPINSDKLSIGKCNAFGVDGKSVACNTSTLAAMLTEPKVSSQQPSFPKGKRITKNSFCVCQNVARAMAFDCTLERLTCRCMSAALANFDSSVVDVTAITMQKSKSEVDYIENTTTVHGSSSDIIIVPNSPVRTKKDSGKTAVKMPGNHKELGLHNYAANPNLEGVFWKGKKTPGNLNTSNAKDLENIQGEFIDVEMNEIGDTRAASPNVTENEMSKRENCHLRGHIDHSLQMVGFSTQTGVASNANLNRVPGINNHFHATRSKNTSQFLPLKSTYNEEVMNTEKSTSSDVLNALPIDHQINSLQACQDKISSDGVSLEELSILASAKRLNNTNCPVLPKNLTDAIKQNSHASFNSCHPKDLYDAKEASEISLSAPHKKNPFCATVNCPISIKGSPEKPMVAAASTSAFCRKSTPVPIKPKPSLLLQSPMNAAMVEQVKKHFMKIGFVFRTPPKTQQQLASQINAAIARSETGDFSPSPIASLTHRVESMQANNARLAQHRKEKVQSLDNADELIIDLSDAESVQSFVDIETVDHDPNIEQSREQKGGVEISDLSLFSSSDEEQEDLDHLRSSLHDAPSGNTASKTVKERMRRRRIQNYAENLRRTLGIDEAHGKMHLKELLDSTKKHISTLQPFNISLNRQVHQLLRRREDLKEKYRELALELPPDQRKKHALTTMSILRTAVPNHGSREFPAPPSLIEMNPYLRPFTKQPSAGVMDASSVSSKTGPVSEKETICIDLVDSEDEAAATNDTTKKDVHLTNHDSHNDSSGQLASGGPLSRRAKQAKIESKLSQYNIQFKTFSPTSPILQDSSSCVRNLNESINLCQTTSTSAMVIQAPPNIALPGVIRPTVIKEAPFHPLSYQPLANCQNTLGKKTSKTTQEIINDNFKRRTNLNNGKMVHITQPERLMVTTVRAPSVSSVTSAGHQRIQSVFSALQQISRPMSLPKQATHNNVNFDSPPSTYCNMAFSSLSDTMPLQKNEDIMNLRQIMDVTDDTKSVASSNGGDEVKGVLKSSETDFILPGDFVATTDLEDALIGVAQELTVSQVEDSPVDRVEELIVNQAKDLSVDRVEELTVVSEIEDLSVNRVEVVSQVEDLSVGELPMEAVKELPVGEVKDIATQNCSNGTEPGS